ncbi:hypothetical protein HG430_002770 [Candidatus Gracilibacteria bacterium]|nr:hypothetical protein [Candidatus Gracilibacteria bacterium]
MPEFGNNEIFSNKKNTDNLAQKKEGISFKEMFDGKEKSSEMIGGIDKSALEQTIQNLKNSINNFKTRNNYVFEGGNMTIFQREKTDSLIFEKAQTIKNLENILAQLEQINSEVGFMNQRLNSYNSNFGKIDVSADKEYFDMQNNISVLKNRIWNLQSQQHILLKNFNLLSNGIKINDKLNQAEVSEMQNISLQEFLNKPLPDRLKSVTIGNISSQDIISGKTKDLEINLLYNNVLNKQLNINLLPSMILPSEVQEIASYGRIYSRTPDGRFVDASGNMLSLLDGTRISITKLGAKDIFQNNSLYTNNQLYWDEGNQVNNLYLNREKLANNNNFSKKIGNLDLSKYGDIVSKEELQEIYQTEKFPPYSELAIKLLTIAARVAGLPESWAKNKNLHFILDKESKGEVLVLNHTLKSKNISKEEFKEKALSGESIGAKSTASGLGQLQLANVDAYYPNGREGLGDPIEEAVGLLKYVKDRYSTPEKAASFWRRNKHY